MIQFSSALLFLLGLLPLPFAQADSAIDCSYDQNQIRFEHRTASVSGGFIKVGPGGLPFSPSFGPVSVSRDARALNYRYGFRLRNRQEVAVDQTPDAGFWSEFTLPDHELNTLDVQVILNTVDPTHSKIWLRSGSKPDGGFSFLHFYGTQIEMQVHSISCVVTAIS